MEKEIKMLEQLSDGLLSFVEKVCSGNTTERAEIEVMPAAAEALGKILFKKIETAAQSNSGCEAPVSIDN